MKNRNLASSIIFRGKFKYFRTVLYSKPFSQFILSPNPRPLSAEAPSCSPKILVEGEGEGGSHPALPRFPASPLLRFFAQKGISLS